MERSRANSDLPPPTSNPDSSGQALPSDLLYSGMGATQVDPQDFQANRSDALTTGTRLEGYVIERVIGASGFGFVYLALDSADSRRVAIKEYLPDTLAVRDEDGMQVLVRADSHIEAFERGRAAFIEEAQLLARCEHPSLLHVTRSWQSKGTAYRVMPYYPGNSLFALREAMDAPADEASLRALLDGLLGALETLHDADVIHREVSPWNILLLPDDTPILLDFNASRRAMVGNRARALMSLLTPTFAPVELTDPATEQPIGPWTDIHSVGAVVKYCISGEMPRAATSSSPRESMGAIVRRLQVSFPKLHYSPSFLTAIDAALATNPEDRPQSVDALRKRLDDHPRAMMPRGDEAFEPEVFEPVEEPAPADVEDAPALGLFPERPMAEQDAAQQSEAAAASPTRDRDRPLREPFVSVLAPTPPSQPHRFEPATNDDAFVASGFESGLGPGLGHMAAQADDRMVGLDFAERSRRNRRRAIAVGAVLALAAVGSAAWWIDQQRMESATQSAFEQALKRDMDVRAPSPADPDVAAKAPEAIVQPTPGPSTQTPEVQTSGTPIAATQTAAPQGPAASQVVAEAAPVSPPAITVEAQPPPAATPTPAQAATPATVTPLPAAPLRSKQAPAGTSSAGTESAVASPRNRAATTKPAAKPQVATRAPANTTGPREACGNRTEFSLYRCMQKQCAQSQWKQHPSCKLLKTRDEVG